MLLSTYTFSQIGNFGIANDTGAAPCPTVALDAAGDLFGTTSAGGTYGIGTVFEIPAGTSTLITLAAFDGVNGAAPQSGPILDSAGNLYGTTEYGGASGRGTVFEVVNGSTTVTTLASFNDSNGTYPNSLAVDSSGNLYGTTTGADGNGTVFEIAKGTPTVVTLASFNGTNGAYPKGVTVDSAGNLYGTTYGTQYEDRPGTGFGTVFEIAKGTNTVTTLASFNGTNGANPVAGVTVDSAGNLYGTTTIGGAVDYGTVFEIANGSHSVTTLAPFDNITGSGSSGLALDSAGNLFGTTTSGTVFEIVNGSTTVGKLTSIDWADGVTLDPSGNLYGTTYDGRYGDTGAGTVFKLASGSNTATTLASFGQTSSNYPANPAAGVVLDSAGNLYGTTEYGGPRITYPGAAGRGTVFEIAKGSSTVTTLATFPEDGSDGDLPVGTLTLDSAGDLFGTTQFGGDVFHASGTVFEIAKGTDFATSLASFDGTTGADPRGGVVLDSAGNLYGTTYSGGVNGDGTVFEIVKGSRTVTTLASFNGANGENPTAGVTLDSAGNLYGTTPWGGASGDGTVFEIAKGSNIVTTLTSFTGTGLSIPSGGVTLDAAGNMYGTTGDGGASSYGAVFEMAKGSTAVTTVVSFNVITGAGPDDVTMDAAGNLYGTTTGGGAHNAGTVFEIVKGSATVTTLASFDRAYDPLTVSDGSAFPNGVTVDSAGNLYGTTAYGGASYAGTVFKLSPALPGDANGDGKVDFSDLLIVAQNYGTTNATWSDGDFNGDGTVNFADLLILAQNYGHTTSLATAVRRASITLPAHKPRSLPRQRQVAGQA